MIQTAQPAAPEAEIIRTPHFHAAAARELLARTVELPSSKRELMDVLSEYRAALFALAVSGAGRSGDSAGGGARDGDDGGRGLDVARSRGNRKRCDECMTAIHDWAGDGGHRLRSQPGHDRGGWRPDARAGRGRTGR